MIHRKQHFHSLQRQGLSYELKNPCQPDRDLRFKHFVLFNYSPKIFLISASISSELMIFPSCSVVTGLHKGTVFVRLKIGVNAVAHSRYDNRMPGKKDKVSFVVYFLLLQNYYTVYNLLNPLYCALLFAHFQLQLESIFFSLWILQH